MPIFKCCCTCCSDLESELPNITIPGMVAQGGWQGLGCCRFRDFVFTSSQESRETCALTTQWTATWQRERTADVTAIIATHPIQLFPPACPPTPCCPPAPLIVGRLEESQTTTRVRTFKIRYYPAVVRVTYSKQEVTCDGVTSCKYVIQSTYTFNYFYQLNLGGQNSQTVDATSLSDCFPICDTFQQVTVNPPRAVDSCDIPFTESVVPGNTMFGSGSFSFDRIKYYDERPTGVVSFGGSDLETCDDNGVCPTAGNYVPSICIYPPAPPTTGPNTNHQIPCWCSTMTETVTTLNCTSPNPCNGTTTIPGYVCDGEDSFCFATSRCVSSGNSPDPCPGQAIQVRSLSFEAAGCTDPTRDVLVTCHPSFGLAGSSWPHIRGQSNCNDPGGGHPFLSPLVRSGACVGPRAACDTDCCMMPPFCAACEYLFTCESKFASLMRTVITEDVITKSCSMASNPQVCVNAPTWSITLS